jgi:signal transduction histidine kinase
MEILLVDDEDHILRVVGDFLRDFGYKVIPARSGEEALRCLEGRQGVALIISDIRMPGIDGFELLDTVNARFTAIPTILTTGHREDNNLLKALRAGAYDYLKKPIRLRSLLNSIDHIEACKRLRERLLSERKSLASGDSGGSTEAGIAFEIQAPLSSALENLQRVGIFWKAVRNDWGTMAKDVQAHDQHRGSIQAEVTNLLGTIRENLASIDGILRDVGILSNPIGETTQEVNLVGCLKEAAETTWASLSEGVELTEDYDDEVLRVQGDRQDLCHLFTHLFQNAARAVGNKQEARISISARTEGTKWTRVEVTDNGDGISRETRSRVFDPFFTTRGGGEGLGLGLFVCERISRNYGGEIGFESHAEGGTTFWVRLRQADYGGAIQPK